MKMEFLSEVFEVKGMMRAKVLKSIAAAKTCIGGKSFSKMWFCVIV